MHGAKIFCDLFMVEHIYTLKKTLIICLKDGNLSSDGNTIELKLYRYLEVYRRNISNKICYGGFYSLCGHYHVLSDS